MVGRIVLIFLGTVLVIGSLAPSTPHLALRPPAAAVELLPPA